jgi:hypothetical protein
MDPQIWRDITFDPLLEIAKWCNELQLLAFTRTCRYFYMSGLFRLAKECQYPDKEYPNKKYLPFLGDLENYMIASRSQFALMSNISMQECDEYIYEYCEMFERIMSNSAALTGQASAGGSNRRDYNVVKIELIKRYVLLFSKSDDIFSDKCVGYYDLREDAVKHIMKYYIDMDFTYDSAFTIIDLSKMSLSCWNRGVKKNESKDICEYYFNGELYAQ